MAIRGCQLVKISLVIDFDSLVGFFTCFVREERAIRGKSVDNFGIGISQIRDLLAKHSSRTELISIVECLNHLSI